MNGNNEIIEHAQSHTHKQTRWRRTDVRRSGGYNIGPDLISIQSNRPTTTATSHRRATSILTVVSDDEMTMILPTEVEEIGDAGPFHGEP